MAVEASDIVRNQFQQKKTRSEPRFFVMNIRLEILFFVF